MQALADLSTRLTTVHLAMRWQARQQADDRLAASKDQSPALASPRWLQIEVRLRRKTRLLSLAEMRSTPSLASMRVLQRGNRLSITPVTQEEWAAVTALL